MRQEYFVLGSWAAQVESEREAPLRFLLEAYKQGAVDRSGGVVPKPAAIFRFEDGDASHPDIADDSIAITERPDGIEFATPLLSASARRRGGRVQARIVGRFDAVPYYVISAHLSVIVRRLLLWMDLFYLHAGAVEWNGAASLFVGEKGAGKSTSCMHLAKAGAQLISEDHILLRRRGADFLVSGSETVGRVTGRTEQHLFASALPMEAQDYAGSWKKEFSLSDHFRCAPRIDFAFHNIFFPRVGDRFALEPLSEMQAALRLFADARQFFRFHGASDYQRFLDFFTGMVAGKRAYLLTLTPNLGDLDQLVELLKHG
jgi:hypothetical protein